MIENCGKTFMFWENVLRRKFDLEDKMSFKTFSQNFYNISNEMKVLFKKKCPRGFVCNLLRNIMLKNVDGILKLEKDV